MSSTRLSLYAGVMAITLGTAFFVASCNKKDKNDTEDSGYATEQSVSEKAYEDAGAIADQASTVSSGSTMAYKSTGITSACATVTRTTGSIIIDFGSVNCLCNDGRNRRGKILVNYTGNYADSGSVRTITFDNYYQNDNKIDGTKTVVNMGHNTLGQPYFNVTVAGTITLASGGTIVTASNRVRTWTDGYTTLTNFSDDKYSLSGTGTITRPSGAIVNVSVSSANPLIFVAGCRWIEAGTITFTLPSGLTRSINYGNTPACDNAAVLTVPSGATYNITLP